MVEQVLETLSQSAWDGRQVGTDGNIKAAEYLAGLLREFGYTPFEGKDYFHPYKQTIPDTSTLPSFKIIYENEKVETLDPGRDFTINRGLPEFTFAGEAVYNPVNKGKGSQVAFYRDAKQALDVPEGYLLTLIKFKSPIYKANGQNLKEPYPVEISSRIFDKLQGQNISGLEIEYTPKDKTGTVNNVIGILKGSDSDSAVILSAHFDGTASYGKEAMTSAYDNGSGTAALMEISRQLAKQYRDKLLLRSRMFYTRAHNC